MQEVPCSLLRPGWSLHQGAGKVDGFLLKTPSTDRATKASVCSNEHFRTRDLGTMTLRLRDNNQYPPFPALFESIPIREE